MGRKNKRGKRRKEKPIQGSSAQSVRRLLPRTRAQWLAAVTIILALLAVLPNYFDIPRVKLGHSSDQTAVKRDSNLLAPQAPENLHIVLSPGPIENLHTDDIVTASVRRAVNEPTLQTSTIPAEAPAVSLTNSSLPKGAVHSTRSGK